MKGSSSRVSVGRLGKIFHVGLGGARGVFTEEMADQPEGHVDTGRDAGAGDDIAVVHIAFVENIGVRGVGAQEIERAAIGRGLAPFKKSGAGEQGSAGAYRSLPGSGCQIAAQFGVELVILGQIGRASCRERVCQYV